MTFYSQIFFYLAIAVTLFLPGYFLLLAVFGKSRILSALERFVLSFGLGLVITDFFAFALNRLGIPITALTALLGSLIFCGVCYGIYGYKNAKKQKVDSSLSIEEETEKLFSFSKNQFVLVLLFLFSMFFIKTAYLTGTVAPTSTDMGHHMYWAKTIAQSGKLTDYEGMPDFIIGEHIIFSEINLLSGADFFSAFPVLVLFLINISGILTVFLLTIRIFKNKNVAIFSLLFLGVLFAVSSPQAKFVSGGVVGNIMGNFLMPLALYFYFRAFEFLKKKDENPQKLHFKFLSLAVFATFGLFYTHHLTAFIFLFVSALFSVLYCALNYSDIEVWGKKVLKMVFSSWVLATFFLGIFFFFFVFTPTYVKGTAVGTAVGAPSKATREGLTFSELSSSIGESRITLGFLGLLLLSIFKFKKRRNFGYVAVFSWAVMLFIMSSFPQVLLVNLPSSRIGNYISYPLSILSAFGVWAIFSSKLWKDARKKMLPGGVLRLSFLAILVFVFSLGTADSFSALKSDSQEAQKAMQETFEASAYLAKNTSSSDGVVKDHNYLTADSWIKLFFMRGYKYPLSRGYFKRYEDETKPRENCTLTMISSPGSSDGNFCFSDTKVNFIMVNPQFDSAQFQKLKNFDQVYMSDGTAVYVRTTD